MLFIALPRDISSLLNASENKTEAVRSIQPSHFNVLEPDKQFVAGVDLQSNVAFHPDVVAAMDVILQSPRAVVVCNNDAVDSRLDTSAVADNVNLVPCIAVIRVPPFPSLGSVLWFCIGGLPHIGPEPHLCSPRLIVDETISPGARRIDVHLRSVQISGLIVVSAPDLDAAVARALAVGLNLGLEFEVAVLLLGEQPDVIVFTAGRCLGGDGAVHHLPIANLVLVLGAALDDPAVQALAVEEGGPAVSLVRLLGLLEPTTSTV